MPLFGAEYAKKDLLSGEENPGLAVPLLGLESGLPNSSAFSLASVSRVLLLPVAVKTKFQK